MRGYLEEVQKVGVIDDDDMREYAWCQLRAQDEITAKIDPTVALWSI
jgi:hypothetical protein